MRRQQRQFERVLSDGWRMCSSADARCLGQDVSRPGFDAGGWTPASVPSTVLASLAAQGVCEDPYFGINLRKIEQAPFQVPWWYRTTFVTADGRDGKTVLLEFDGINYAADVWLNGRQVAAVAEARGAFRRFQFDVSDFVQSGENALAVRVVPPAPGDFSTGFVDWNPPPPDRNLGLFRPVRLRLCDGASIEHPFVQTRLDLDTLAEAHLTISADLVNHRDRAISGILEARIEGAACACQVHLQPCERQTVVLAATEHAPLRLAGPRIWWPHDLGEPELYELELRLTIDSAIVDEAFTRFGVREVADYWTTEGHRGFKVNGKDVLIKGAGWTDDLLLADTPESIEAELQYVRHMNLNCIRCEGIWGKDQTLYDLCDRYGLLMMVGYSCHWEHEQYLGRPVDERYGGVTCPEEIELVARSWQDQLLWLRNHPSIFVWAVASDKVPAPALERRYVEIFRRYDPTRPHLISTGGVGSEQRIIGREEVVSDLSGGSGVKMLGPYAYTPPIYWYTDTRRGGAYGFNTETSPGAVVPTLESIRRMMPPEHHWPIDACWDFHCGLNEFADLDRYQEAIRRRYGKAEGPDEFVRKAQALNYELVRPMFEAFRVRKGRATGVIQWMLNAAWPKMYWQLYDWFLMPTGAFYGTRKACEPLQLIYDYGRHRIHLVNDRLVDAEDLTAEIRLYDGDSNLFLASHFPVNAPGGTSREVFALPSLRNLRTTYFLSLGLFDAEKMQIADNFYWLSTKPDVLDYAAKVEPWEFYTPSREYADLTRLGGLPPADVAVKCAVGADEEGDVTVELTNRSDRIAFVIELLLTDERTGEPITPIFWQDNYVSLLPNGTRMVAASFEPVGETSLVVRGWNMESQHHRITRR